MPPAVFEANVVFLEKVVSGTHRNKAIVGIYEPSTSTSNFTKISTIDLRDQIDMNKF